MKKTILLAIALLFSTMIFAQNRAILLNETFDSSSLPEGWTTSETGAENWTISQTNIAGGSAEILSILYSLFPSSPSKYFFTKVLFF